MKNGLSYVGVVLAAGALAGKVGGAPPASDVSLRSEVLAPGVPMREAERPVTRVELAVRVGETGGGPGTLTLDTNAPEFDEFGTPSPAGTEPPLRLECVVKFVKKGRVQAQAGPPPEEWLLYEIAGPKIVTPLFLATPGPGLAGGRLIVRPDGKKVAAVVPLAAPPSGPALPCHPGCFPAGTAVAVPGGVRPIEAVKGGTRSSRSGRTGRPRRGAWRRCSSPATG